MDYARMASGLLARLRKETNGAVVGDMERRGLRYQRNYGVSLVAVRQAAREYAPDHNFARYLWTQPVRELKLAATVIADPQQVTLDDLKYWFSGVENSELAENLSSMLARTTHVDHIFETCTGSDNPSIVYTALLTAVKGFSDGSTRERVVEVTDKITSHNILIENAMELLLSREYPT